MTAKQLTALRAKHNITRDQLADKLGCSPESVKSWELDRRPIEKITALAIQHVLTCGGK